MDKFKAQKDGRAISVEGWIKSYSEEVEMDMSKYGQGPSNDLKAAEYKGQNLKVVITGVTTRTYPARDDQPEDTKAVLEFEGKEKVLVVSHPNCDVLRAAYGDDSDGWIGHEIGLSTKTWPVGEGWVLTPLDVAAPEFDDDIPF